MCHIRSFLSAVLAAILLVTASAAGETAVSARVNAIRCADRALEENYGITLLLQDYLRRTVEETDAGVYTVSYEGAENLAYVLGRYEVTVSGNQAAGVTWSHDGEDTSGGFEAEAWGAEQIMEMLLLNQETGLTEPFDARADEIGREHGFVYAPTVLSDEESEAEEARAEKECEEARSLSTLSVDEMAEIARHAAASLYGLSPEQEQALEFIIEEEERPLWYMMFEGEPCYPVCFALDSREDDDVLPNGLIYTDKEGTYWIYINTRTGTVEDVYYSCGIGGNG